MEMPRALRLAGSTNRSLNPHCPAISTMSRICDTELLVQAL
jgi:hypothetical protein